MITYNFYRNAYLSIIKAVRDLVPANVDVVDETEENLTTATVGVYPGAFRYAAFELGNADDSDVFTWNIGVYADTPHQRDYLSLLVYNKLKDWNIEVKDYSGSEAKLGTLYVDKNIFVNPRRAPEEAIDKLRYFSLLTFQTTYQEL